MSLPEDIESDVPTANSPSPELLEKAKDLIANIKLFDIRPCSLAAKLSEAANPRDLVTSIESDLVMSFRTEEGVYINRFDFSYKLKGGEDRETDLANIEFSIMLDYQVSEKFVPDPQAAEFVTTTTGVFAAYPYARELLQSLATRLQFDPVVFGHLDRGSLMPKSVNVVRQSDTQD